MWPGYQVQQVCSFMHDMHACIHAFIPTCIHYTHIHACIHTYTRTYVHTYVHTYIRHACIHTYIHIHVRHCRVECTCMCVRICMSAIAGRRVVGYVCRNTDLPSPLITTSSIPVSNHGRRGATRDHRSRRPHAGGNLSCTNFG